MRASKSCHGRTRLAKSNCPRKRVKRPWHNSRSEQKTGQGLCRACAQFNGELQAPNTATRRTAAKNGGQKFTVRQIAPEGDRPGKPAFPRKKKTKPAIPSPPRVAKHCNHKAIAIPSPTRLPTARALAPPHPERAHASSKNSGTRQQSRTHKARQSRPSPGVHPCLFKKSMQKAKKKGGTEVPPLRFAIRPHCKRAILCRLARLPSACITSGTAASDRSYQWSERRPR